MIGVNLWGVIHGVKVFTPLMLAQNTECHIVNTASMAGLIASGTTAPYAATKHAVVALSENLYLALEQRNALVKVSVLCPGFVKTNIASAERNRPVGLQNEPVEISPQGQANRDLMNAAVEAGMSPLQVADQVFEAIKEERFYILTHPEFDPAGPIADGQPPQRGQSSKSERIPEKPPSRTGEREQRLQAVIARIQHVMLMRVS